jgi:beta-N-acetylglucosaminidase
MAFGQLRIYPKVLRGRGAVISKKVGKTALFTLGLGLCLSFLYPSLDSYASDFVSEVLDEVNDSIDTIRENKEILATIYLCDTYDIKDAPSKTAGTVQTVFSGQSVTILENTTDEEGNVWAKVSFFYGEDKYGYVERSYLATADNDYLGAEEDAGIVDNKIEDPIINFIAPKLYMKSGNLNLNLDGLNRAGIMSEGDTDSDVSENEIDMSLTDGEDGEETPSNPDPYPADIMAFPESYREALAALKNAHPNWTFVKMPTGVSFQTAVNSELGDKSLIHSSLGAAVREGLYGQNTWYYATPEILSYYMDPRNFLNEEKIFQFELLTYNAEYHTQPALETFLSTTFMKGPAHAPQMDITYADIIWNLSRVKNISPFFLASRIYQEQGNGTSPMISGTYPGYEGYYNYLNIGASGKTNAEVITNGLSYAKNSGWSDPYKAIDGGADQISKNYVLKGQDTLYLQKFNVNPATGNMYGHQYMQNISAASSESSSTKKMYAGAGSLNQNFVFKIPVYNDMPDTPSPYPQSNQKAVLYLPDSAASNNVTLSSEVWIDGVKKTSTSRNRYIVVDTESQSATNAVIYKYNSAGTCTGMYVWLLNYANGGYSVTYESELEDLLNIVGFSIRIKGDSGIRAMTSINRNLRLKLLNQGVDGYKATEYGTVVMTKNNQAVYPFVRGGEKTAVGLAYGTDSSGKRIDAIYETVDGRDRFTSVLIGLPAKSYKKDYSFRGYIVLKNSTRTIVIYGPPSSNSIYNLANIYIAGRYYKQGSAADIFLRQIIADGDNPPTP